MARYVKLSTVAPEPPRYPAGRTAQEAVEQMIGFWRGRLAQVWPDQPDLVLVPEACDRFSGQSAKAQAEYYEARGNQVRDFFAATAKEHGCYLAYSAVHKMEDGTWRNSIQLMDRQGGVMGALQQEPRRHRRNDAGGDSLWKGRAHFRVRFWTGGRCNLF